MTDFRVHSRGYLPHFVERRATYFITFRLGDSLPKHVLDGYKQELLDARLHPKQSEDNLSLQYEEKILRYLDAGAGACYMNDARIATIVEDTLRHFDNERYFLYAWCVMPNHVHTLVSPFDGYSLSSILHSWKLFSSRTANAVLGRSGRFWQPESYDHLVRSDEEFTKVMEYILNNPISAGLKNWKWVGYGDVMRVFE